MSGYCDRKCGSVETGFGRVRKSHFLRVECHRGRIVSVPDELRLEKHHEGKNDIRDSDLLGAVVAGRFRGFGAGQQRGVIKLNGGRNAILMRAPSQPFTPAVRASSTLVTIYSTLGKGDHVYSTLSGFGILGTNTGQILPEMVGERLPTDGQPRCDRSPSGRNASPGHECAGGQLESGQLWGPGEGTSHLAFFQPAGGLELLHTADWKVRQGNPGEEGQVVLGCPASRTAVSRHVGYLGRQLCGKAGKVFLQQHWIRLEYQLSSTERSRGVWQVAEFSRRADRFDLSSLTCYKNWSCAAGIGQGSSLSGSTDTSDAAKLSIPVQVLQWKRVRNSGYAFPHSRRRAARTVCRPRT